MELKELKMVLAIAKHGSLVRAVRVLGTSQPALARALGALDLPPLNGIRLSGGFPAGAVKPQVFKASMNSLAAAAKLADEPTSLFWDRTGLSVGDTRWYWLRAVSAEGNVSTLAGSVSAAAL